MASRNENNPFIHKKRPAGDGPVDKRRKLGTDRNMGSTTSSQIRHALAPVTTNQEVAATHSEVPRDENMEFTKEKVDTLLKERFKEKMHPYLKAAMKNKEEDFNATICKIEADIATLRKELREANRANEQLESEKAAILQELSTLKARNNFHAQLTKPDPFSLLHDDILLDIMSRIKCTTKELIRTTSTISRRWRNLWASVPHLIFNEIGDDTCTSLSIEPFFSFIDNTINLCPRYPKLKLFELLTHYDTGPEFKSRFNSWIRYAISRNIEKLDLKFWCFEPGKFTYDDELFFNSSCITHITLLCCLFNPPNGVINWGRLESLSIIYGYLDEDMLEKILSGSPCLETLELNNCYGYRRINITSKSVKKFVFSRYNSNRMIDRDEDYIDCVKINAPYISSLTIKGDLVLREIALLNMSSLVEANLDYSIDWREISQDKILRGILESLKHVKDITFGWHLNANAIELL